MKFCPQCGAKLSDGVRFCTECGARLAAPVSAEPVYDTPAQQAHEAPVQQTYVPPVQSKAERPAATARAPKVPGAKKSGKKRLIPIIAGAAAVVVLLVVLLFIYGGKDQGTEADWGVYEGVSCVVSDVELGADDEWIELKEKGKVTVYIMGDEYSGKWTLNGKRIVIEQDGDEFFGTLKNGVLEVDFAGTLYTFQKDGAADASGIAAKLPGKSDNKEKQDDPVTYKLVAAYADGEEISDDLLEMMGGGWVIFNGDGTGTFAVFGEKTAITYDDSDIKAGGEKIAYTRTDDGMEFSMDDGSEFVLEITEEVPDLSAFESGEEEPEDPDEPEADVRTGIQAWSGDYYGYWIVDSVWETKQDWLVDDAYWDCCATVEIDADGTGTMIIWDEDFTKEMPLAELGITVSENDGVARFCGEEGYFMGEPLEHADWLWYSDATEYGDMLVIDGEFDDGEDDFWYIINLRPWGSDWSDVEANEEIIPAHYYDWYMPMVEDGAVNAPADSVGR